MEREYLLKRSTKCVFTFIKSIYTKRRKFWSRVYSMPSHTVRCVYTLRTPYVNISLANLVCYLSFLVDL